MQEKIFALAVVKAEYSNLLKNRLQYLQVLDEKFKQFAAKKHFQFQKLLGEPADPEAVRDLGVEFFQELFGTEPTHASLFFETFQSGYSDALRRVSYPLKLRQRLPFSTHKTINEVGDAYLTLMRALDKQAQAAGPK